ncbi:Uma2 family endonuclease [Tundrisphaera sp. TA3]|uniref:Uma2 family endonuclease n=1 Tax=Tundrisphaera sp. TA3 TaxID=3435775 RepID=UPI003EB728E0
MSTSTRITVEEYAAMIERGDFEPREQHRVELIRGEIVPKDPRGPMSPINSPHIAALFELTDWSYEVLPRGLARVSVQSSVQIEALDSETEPDLAWLARRDYRAEKPTSADVLLVIEVSDTTLKKDRTTKAALYAEAGIRDYWIVNIPGRCIEVHRDPEAAAYRSITPYADAEVVHPLAVPGAALPVARIFP